MLNFTLGPVQVNQKISSIGGDQPSYFRTKEFSLIVKECEKLLKKTLNAPLENRAIFLTGSGTAAMEASIINTLSEKDNALIINGGTFGQRFVEICEIHKIKHSEVKLDFGKTLKKEDLYKFNGNEYTCLIINSHETSSGTKYDMDMVSSYCKQYNLLLIIDAIGSAFADEFDINKYGADVVIVSSQKALACAPGLSMVVLSNKAIDRVNNVNPNNLYFDFKIALDNANRGQTPFTPAITIIKQLHTRLQEIDKNGYNSEVNKTKLLAEDFRKKIIGLPFKIVSNNPSNAVTALYSKSAKLIFSYLQEKYNIFINPNGGEYANNIFRVGHLGNLTTKDNDALINAFLQMKKDGLI